MPSAHDRIELPYNEAREHIRDADVLLYSGHGLIPGLIKIAGLSTYSHVGLAGWANGNPESRYSRLMVYEMRVTGGQGTSLSSYVEKWPGRIHVYRVSDFHTVYEWNEALKSLTSSTKVLERKSRKLAVAIMQDFCRPGEYGMMHLWWTALVHLPGLRIFFRPPTDDQLEDRSRPPYCSEAVAWALRKAFTDVVKNMPDHYTSPGALARSPLLHYMFTLQGSVA